MQETGGAPELGAAGLTVNDGTPCSAVGQVQQHLRPRERDVGEAAFLVVGGILI